MSSKLLSLCLYLKTSKDKITSPLLKQNLPNLAKKKTKPKILLGTSLPVCSVVSKWFGVPYHQFRSAPFLLRADNSFVTWKSHAGRQGEGN